MEKKILVALLVVLVLGVVLPFGKESKTIIQQVGDELKGVASPYLDIGAVSLYSQGSTALTQATNTILCSLQSPAGTSTLMKAGFSVTSGTSSVTYLGISRSSTQGAIGTGVNLFASTTVPANGVAYITASSTSVVFSPNTYLNFSQTNGGILNQTGSCEALWLVI